MIILDTNVISEPLKPQPDPAVADWLDAQDPRTLYLTTITVAEIRFAVACLPHGARREVLERGFASEALPLFADRILSFDQAAADAYGVLRARMRADGLAIGDIDALIAAVAASREFAVATRDTSPFEAAGVEVINPFGPGA